MAESKTYIIKPRLKGMGPAPLAVANYDEAMAKARQMASYIDKAGGYVTIDVVSKGEVHTFWDTRYNA